MTTRALMPRLAAFLASLALAAPALAAPALAQDAPDLSFGDAVDGTLSTQGRERLLIFSVLAGAQTTPEYFGAEDNETRPSFNPSLLALSFRGLQIADRAEALDSDPVERAQGFAVGPSFRFVSAREAGDHDELSGLDDIDGALEVGVIAGYGTPSFEAFGAMRYGVTGHESWMGELGANFVARPTNELVLRAGPRATFGSDGYNDTYYGVSDSEAAASGLDAFDPDAGLTRAGVEVIATYQLGARWWLEGRARYDRLQNDAADSPITRQGSADQSTVSIGLRRAFVLEF